MSEGVDPRDLGDALADRAAFVRQYRPSMTVNWRRFMVGVIVHESGINARRVTVGQAGFSVAVGPVLLNLLWTDRDAQNKVLSETADEIMRFRVPPPPASMVAVNKAGDSLVIRRPVKYENAGIAGAATKDPY